MVYHIDPKWSSVTLREWTRNGRFVHGNGQFRGYRGQNGTSVHGYGCFCGRKLCLRSKAIKKAVFLAEKGKMGTLSKNWAVFLAGKVQISISMDGVVQNRVVCPPKAGFHGLPGTIL